jgi:Flp pilus assembly pilin Flp
MIKRFLCDESGPAAVEYAVILALITIVALPAMTILGTEIREVYEKLVRVLQHTR